MDTVIWCGLTFGIYSEPIFLQFVQGF